MYKHFLFFIILIVLFSDIKAQKGNNALSLNAKTAIPFFQNDPGFGFFLKGMYGIGQSGQLTLSAGVSKFNSKYSIEKGKVSTRLVPFLFGYKQNIHKFYIEPRIGIGELGGKLLINGDYARPSVAAMFGGLGAGYAIKRFNFDINFLTAHGIENATAGIWYNKNFHYTGVFLGYDFFSKSKH